MRKGDVAFHRVVSDNYTMMLHLSCYPCHLLVPVVLLLSGGAKGYEKRGGYIYPNHCT